MYCQLTVVAANSMATGISGLECSEEGNFIQFKQVNWDMAWL